MSTDTSNIKTAEEARDYAITWQHWQGLRRMSYGELQEWQQRFEELARKFGLTAEFKENGIL